MRKVLTLLAAAVFTSGTAFGQVRAPAPGKCEPEVYMRALGESRWVDALAHAERCYDDYDRQPSDGNWGTLNVGLRVYYRLAAAQLLALLGRNDDARSMLDAATNEAYASGIVSTFLIPMPDMLALTDAFIRERRGDARDARDRYARIAFGAAKGRSALLALGAGDDIDARLWGRRGEIDRDPTAQYVLGALDELRGDRAMALYYYLRAQSALATLARGSATLPVVFFERERIDAAIARMPGPDGARVVVEGRLRTYVDADGRRIAAERWPGVLAVDAARVRQRAYNEWAATKRGAASELLVFVPQYPRQFVVESSRPEGIEALRVPGRIETTGVLDLDTIAVGYYRAAVEWAELCASARFSRAALERPFVPPPAGAADERREAVRWLLVQAYYDLRRLRAFLSGVVMSTAAGDQFDGVDEARRYASNLARLRELRDEAGAASAGPFDGLPQRVVDDPPDFVTAHVRAEGYTPEFVQHLLLRERTVRGRLFLARSVLETAD